MYLLYTYLYYYFLWYFWYFLIYNRAFKFLQIVICKYTLKPCTTFVKNSRKTIKYIKCPVKLLSKKPFFSRDFEDIHSFGQFHRITLESLFQLLNVKERV